MWTMVWATTTERKEKSYFSPPQQESYDSLPNVVIILNPNGTVNEELMLAHGMNLETIKAVTEQGINLQVRHLKM